MKKSIFASIVIVMCVMSAVVANAATTVTKSGNQFTQVTTRTAKAAVPAVKTDSTYKIKDTVYPIYRTAKGKLFINKTSKKSGKEYRQYINLNK